MPCSITGETGAQALYCCERAGGTQSLSSKPWSSQPGVEWWMLFECQEAGECLSREAWLNMFMLNSFKYGFTMFHYFHGMLWLYVICASLSYTHFCWVHFAIVAWHWVFVGNHVQSIFHLRTAFNRSSAPCERADHFDRFRCRCSIRLTIPSPRIPKEPLSNNVFLLGWQIAYFGRRPGAGDCSRQMQRRHLAAMQ